MKTEFNECMTDCKHILEHLENKVQQNMLKEIIGPEQIQLTELLDNSSLTQIESKRDCSGLPLKSHEHLNFNGLNSMTVSHFEQNFVQEINEAVT